MSPCHSRDPRIACSLRHSVRDGAAYSVMAGSGESYLTPFALFLKATTTQIGFLASVPPLLASFAQLFSAWLGRRTGQRRKIILFGVLVQGLIWLPLASLPLLFPAHAVSILIVCVVLYYALGNLVEPQWASLMGELVAEKRRGRYFAMRNRVCSLTSFLALVVGGLILQIFDRSGATVGGFLLIFSIAFVARFISYYHLLKMHDPGGHVALLEVPVGKKWWAQLRHSQFVRFSSFFALMQLSVAVASPFFAVYLLRDLHFSYVQLMACMASSVLMQFLTLNRWGAISDMFGNRVVLQITGVMIPLVPFLWLFSDNFYYLLCTQAFGGFVWAGFSLSASNFLYDLLHVSKRSTYLAVHNVFASIGGFIGAMVGGYLGMHLPQSFSLLGVSINWQTGLYNVFILSFALRMLTSLLLIPRLREARTVRPISLGRLIFRVGRFSAVSGLIFNVVGNRKKTKSPAA